MKFKSNLSVTIILVICSFVQSCSRYSPRLEAALSLAGENRVELEKVLAHYRGDRKKYKAACFLIENMVGRYTLTSQKLDSLDAEFFDAVGNLDIRFEDTEVNVYLVQVKVNEIWNRVLAKYGDPTKYHYGRSDDLRSVRADYLIDNIDEAFATLDYPWTSHLSFEDFCEYVLPYRYGSEPLTEGWRHYFRERYKWIADSLAGDTDPVAVCRLINQDIATWFLPAGGGHIFKNHPRSLSVEQLRKCRLSSCVEQAAVALFAMRSMGLAVAHCTIPHWGNRSAGHDFNAILTRDNEWADFSAAKFNPGENEMANKPPKVFVKKFSRKMMPEDELEIVRRFDFPYAGYQDVTSHLVKTSDVTVRIPDSLKKDVSVVYLCVFNNKRWVPVTYSYSRNGKAKFAEMGRRIVYLPQYYTDGRFFPVSDPIFLEKDGRQHPAVADSVHPVSRMVLTRKYGRFKYQLGYAGEMVGARFQGADNPDFENAVTLFTIDSLPDSKMDTFAVAPVKCRYVRYLYPDIFARGNAGNVAEIAFVGEDGKPLQGKYIGIKEANASNIRTVFDGNTRNYLRVYQSADSTAVFPGNVIVVDSPKPIWVGLDLGGERTVTGVAYCPRNDSNNIYPHCTYELFCWDGGWKSLGQRTGQKDSLVYENVPSGCLYILRNRTEGKEERLFTYENGKQVWW